MDKTESPNQARTYVQAHFFPTIKYMLTGLCSIIVQPTLQKKLSPKLHP